MLNNTSSNKQTGAAAAAESKPYMLGCQATKTLM